MASSTTPGTQPRERILGSAPEPFDGKSAHAKTFWNTLENYYYLNDSVFPNEGKKVAAALTHFKLGTLAGDWAAIVLRKHWTNNCELWIVEILQERLRHTLHPCQICPRSW